jgi:ferredoxin
MPQSTLLLWTLAGANLLFLGGFAVVSLQEGEKRASAIAALLTFITTGALTLAGFLPVPLQNIILLTMAGMAVLGVVLFLLPGKAVKRARDRSLKKFDERDVMFARARLQPGSADYKSYYALHPENEAIDNLFRSKPGLLASNSRYADPVIFAVPKASFTLTETMHGMVDGDPSAEVTPLPENPALTELVKSLTRYLGAVQVGITSLRPEHVYSHIGRGSGEYGAPIVLDHQYAIAFTVEMDHTIMGSAPQAPVVMESAKQYVEAATVAVQLAQTIRTWGYPARAHTDGDYRVICPLVARDAGLGEIGRMGLLMTPLLGPRVRIAVVTTDLELVPDVNEPDASMIDFCTVCGKCAENCPAKAISFADRVEIDGALRWRINSDLCFRYWTAIGTDCGRCMRVCPYSHPDTFYHNLIRWGNMHSGLFRRAVLVMDDLFYGKHPKPRTNRKFSSTDTQTTNRQPEP